MLAFSPAHAVDVATLFPNIGFENGNLTGWTLTLVNTDYVSTLTPPVNPSIDPADAGNNPTTLTAPVGVYFTGLMRVGDVGADLKYKLAHDAIAINVPTGTVFTVTVRANRGRLEPFDTPVSTADVLVRIFGWTAGATPTVTAATDNWSRSISWNPAAQSFDFTGVTDGSWGQRTLTFDPAAAGVNAANIKFLSISLAGRTNNHDQYIALDIGDAPTPSRPTTWGRVKALYR
jgi:hypothetical protein